MISTISLILTILVGCQAINSENSCFIEKLREQRLIQGGICCVQQLDKWIKAETDFYNNTNDRQRQRPMRMRVATINEPRIEEPLTYEKTRFWEKVCWRWKAAAVCVNVLTPGCNISVAYHVLRYRTEFYWYSEQIAGIYGINAFYDRTCSDGKLRPDIKALIEKSGVNTSCLNTTERKTFKKCFEPLANEMRFQQFDIFQMYISLKDHYNRLAVGTFSCMRTVVLGSTCNADTKKVLLQIARLHMPTIFNVSELNFTDAPNYDFTAEQRCTVGVYGDPHLKVCWDEHLQTCSAPGQQKYLFNTVFAIYGVNKRISGSRATNCKELRMDFKSYDGSLLLGVYRAKEFNLPSTFIGNITKVGSGRNEVTIRPGAHNQQLITHRGLGLLIMVRRWRDNYFFTVRMAENAINESSGLLSTGCPNDQLIRRGRWIGTETAQALRIRRKASRPCLEACKEIADDEFKEICEFDCTVTGDTQYANITMDALTDIEKVALEDESLRKNAVPPTETSGGESTFFCTTLNLFMFVLSSKL